MPSSLSGVSLILGGARSGKSTFAERLCDESGRQKVYLATSQALDGEMQARILHHKARRGIDWQLVEEPLGLGSAVNKVATGKTVILVDCLTLWLTNLMTAARDVEAESQALVEVLSDIGRDKSVLLVSNEVGHGIVPMDKMARDFRDHAGWLHQEVAAIANNVWFVTAGLPQKLK
ncbi:MAG: bifunctional adenosylcobinamide kinase/adenosylcobinamide-phosphate guanylyltransferase [Rhizobiaceae bacterium]